MSDPQASPVILRETEGTESRRIELAAGVVYAFTSRAPDKSTVNEDTVGVLELDEQRVVLALADGAGGMPAGKKASLTAIETLLDALPRAGADSLLGAVVASIQTANQAVMSMLNGSATTLSIVTIDHGVLRSFQVGDSEALVTGQRGKLKLCTTPHSPTGFAVQAGYLDEQAALFHPDRHLVSNFVGMTDMNIDVGGELELDPFDTLVLSSDGLTDNLFRQEVIDIVRKGPLDRALEKLTETALDRMREPSEPLPCKPDDLSILLYRGRRASH